MYLIIDGSSLLSTNYYGTIPIDVMKAKTDEEKDKAYKKIMQTSDGVYTNGVFSSLRSVLRMIEDQNPEGIAVCFDVSKDTFRRTIYSDYKGQRGETPNPLKEQFGTFNKILTEIGIPTFYSHEYEADDLAGSIAKTIEKLGGKCAVISADKDYYQLVSEKTDFWRIIPSPAKKKYENLYGINFSKYSKDNNLPAGIFKIDLSTGIIADKDIIHITPTQFIDYLAVVGDKVDNIPGVNLVGPNTIVPLLQKYGSLENIYDIIKQAEKDGKLDKLASEIKSIGVKKNPIKSFIEHEDDARMSKLLAKINCSCNVPNNINDYQLDLDYNKLAEVIDRYEFKSLKDFVKEQEFEIER